MKKRVLSGMRATGKLHLGHLAGVLVNWKRLQNEYESYFFVADWHGLTDNPENAKYMKENIRNMVLDWLAVGIDPQKATLFIQSLVPQHAELHLVFSMLVSLSRLFRNPTYKDKLEDLRKGGVEGGISLAGIRDVKEELERKADEELKATTEFVSSQSDKDAIFRKLKSDVMSLFYDFVDKAGEKLIEEMLESSSFHSVISYGFLGYPVLQSADILLYKPHYVPVGADQVAHIEITRDIAEKFNRLYGEVFPIPEALLTETPKIPGMDGRKMSKSYGNAIYLSDDEETVSKKVMKYITDPQRIRKSDPGRPEICPVFALHKVFNKEETDEIYKACTTAQIGCVQCKRRLAEKLNETLKPIREKRKELESQNIDVFEVLKEGSRKAQEFASGTMDEVRKAMGMDY